MAEQKKFLNGPEIAEITRNVIQRLHPAPEQVPFEKLTSPEYVKKPWKTLKKASKAKTPSTSTSTSTSTSDSPTPPNENTPIQQSVQESPINSNWTLTPKHINAMYLTCAFEIAFNNSDNWCTVFSQDELETLEYMGDLKHYWGRGK